ncbi:MAG: hypothetical protein A2958_03155 [Candidatus Levybacteria bacterium RIFCSPLOWO2_01_FULL_38_13]|nr:MAG: hypothetical protein A2629_03570 [Candidatus Levybacteria bacterium RIFCSPHIGHO2_01_FULL_41_15]OGH35318.1 MAG: hypothetical protein A2958_03155 [Candidatus Levybacteria bacterium RIFCSPLOWO2_01_FULL_38_13]
MIDLTNMEEIKKLDPKNVYESTEMFVDQCEQIWTDVKNITYPQEYNQIKNVVICGMGGSSYGGRIIQNLFKETLTIPVYINDDYNLPAYVGRSSLVLLSSYSGTTKEVLSAGKIALAKDAKVTWIASNNSLAKLLNIDSLPGVVFDPRYNPCGQPRLGTGYSILGAIAILNQIGLVRIEDRVIQRTIDELRREKEKIKSQAIEFAKKIFEGIPVIFAAEFLKGNAYVLRNQINETAKSFSSFNELPDLNHHLMEGLKNPTDKKLIVLFLSSDLYSDDLKKRITLTKEVVKKNSIPVLEYQPQGREKISQILDLLFFGGYLALYLSFLYGQDPGLIPWVDYFKTELSKK